MEKFKGKNILVTGGLGFIGSNLIVNILKYDPEKLFILDNLPNIMKSFLPREVFQNPKVEFIHDDILNINQIEKLKSGVDIVFHLAAQPDVRVSVKSPMQDFKVNVKGSLEMLEFSRQNNVHEFLFASSGGTLYGEKENTMINETTPPEPISNYGAAKAAVEMYLSSYSSLYGIRNTALRLGNVYGPFSTHGVIFDFFMKLKRNPDTLKILGNGTQAKTYVHVKDVVEAFIFLVERKGRQYEYFNVTYPKLVSVKTIADLIVKKMGLKNTNYLFTQNKRGWKGDVTYVNMSIHKLENLGWKPKISIEEGITDYLKWLNQNYSELEKIYKMQSPIKFKTSQNM